MTTQERDAFYTVAYDLPSEMLGFCTANPKDDEETQKKKEKTRSEIGKLRHRFRNTLLQYGRFVNNSVFIIPKVSIEQVNTSVEQAREEYAKLNEQLKADYKVTVGYDITTIAFDTSESVRLRGKAKEALMRELNKDCDTLDERINNLSTKGRGTTPKSILTANGALDEVVGIIDKFKLTEDPDIQALVKQVSLKIQDLGNLKSKGKQSP